MWDQLSELKQSLTGGGVTPKEIVTLRTKTVKLALAGYLLQSVLIAFSWTMRDGNALAWLIPISAFIHIGWFWNKCIESWKRQQDYLPMSGVESARSYPIPTPPPINLSNSPITSRTQQPLGGSMDSLWHTAPESIL